ncbi:hypothetical protein MRB53_029275 [Persea americana]|uniref:Uncharacterized protein n=1 Tax=Persea americana TaxID=3435 RepID=A0ACC2KI37_PERAE|nr:hypothetical protein MRB53_029275 [Persea americana]
MADFVGDYSEASLYEDDADGYSCCLAHDDEYVDDNSGYCVRSTSDDDYEYDEDHVNDNDRYRSDDDDYVDDNCGYCLGPTSDDDYEYDDDDDEDHGNNDSDRGVDQVCYFRGPTYGDGYEDLTINNLSNAFDRVELVDEVGSIGYGYHDWTDNLFDDWDLSLSDYEGSEFDANFSDFDFL